MRRSRAFSIVEILIGLTVLTLMLTAVTSLFLGGFRSYHRTGAQVELSQKNAQGLRQVVEALKDAVVVAVSTDGKTITYSYPQRTAVADPVTGEKEYVDPLTSDGVSRTFTVTAAGKLTNGGTRTFVSKITATDPDPGSSSYAQPYQPFTITTVGSTKALTVNLITLQKVHGKNQFARMKTTVLLRNCK